MNHSENAQEQQSIPEARGQSSDGGTAILEIKRMEAAEILQVVKKDPSGKIPKSTEDLDFLEDNVQFASKNKLAS